MHWRFYSIRLLLHAINLKLTSFLDPGHHNKTILPASIPTVPQLRPVLEAISRGSSPVPPEQVTFRVYSSVYKFWFWFVSERLCCLFCIVVLKLLKTSDQQGSNKGPDLHSESKGSPVRCSQQASLPVQPSLQTSAVSSSLQLNSLPLNSRSLTLKHTSRSGSKSQLPAMHADNLESSPRPGILSSSSLLANHNTSSSSISYDNVIPTDPQAMAQRGAPPVSYPHHFMTLGTDGNLQRSHPRTYSPVFMGISRQSPQPRDPSPSLQGLTSRDASPSFQGFIQRVPSPAFQGLLPRDLSSQSVMSRDVPPLGLAMRDAASQSPRGSLRDLIPPDMTPPLSAAARYDNFSKAIMASIHERRELEERERMLRRQVRTQALFSPDMGIYDIPSRRSLPPDNIRPLGSRGPTPPAYGSREFLMSTGVLGYNIRTSPLSSSSTSSLTHGPKTSSSPLQNSSSSLQSRGRSSSPACYPPERPAPGFPSSTSTLPRFSSSSTSSAPLYASYANMKRSSLPYSGEGKDSVTLGALKWKKKRRKESCFWWCEWLIYAALVSVFTAPQRVNKKPFGTSLCRRVWDK